MGCLARRWFWAALAAACAPVAKPGGAVDAGLWPLPAYASSGTAVVALGHPRAVFEGQPCAVSVGLQARLREALTSELGASESDVARVFRNEDPLEVIATSAGLRKLTKLIKAYREREQEKRLGVCFRGLDSDTSDVDE